MSDNCPRCDRPIATEEHWNHPDGCECADCRGAELLRQASMEIEGLQLDLRKARSELEQSRRNEEAAKKAIERMLAALNELKVGLRG